VAEIASEPIPPQCAQAVSELPLKISDHPFEKSLLMKGSPINTSVSPEHLLGRPL